MAGDALQHASETCVNHVSDDQFTTATIGPVAQLYALVDRLLTTPHIVAFPVAQRYAVAGQVAGTPDEHARLLERLYTGIATCIAEENALNALYLIEICRELVPGFGDSISQDRLVNAAQLSRHARVKSAIIEGDKPGEWERATNQTANISYIFLDEQRTQSFDSAGRSFSDGAKFVTGAAFGGLGSASDALGLTTRAEARMLQGAEGTVDFVGSSVRDTAGDIRDKGVACAVGDGIADAADVVSGLVGDAVQGIAGGVRGALDWVSVEGPNVLRGSTTSGIYASHRLAIVVAELFGEERSLGLRLENRIVTRLTKPEASGLGWHLGDCVAGIGDSLVATQEDMLAAIGTAKEALKSSGTPIRFLVERVGDRPLGPARGSLVFVNGRSARVQEVDAVSAQMTVRHEDDGALVRVNIPQQ